jgi:mevalonate kinase
MAGHYRSNGKLLLTAEYFIMNGATALVLPLRLGQELHVDEVSGDHGGLVIWTAKYREQPWFTATIKVPELLILKTSDPVISRRLVTILEVVKSLKPALFDQENSLIFNTSIDFDPQWGMGSSSTLLTNLAAWADIAPLNLFNKVSDGSAYDMAAASRKQAFLYHRSGDSFSASPVELSPAITPHLYFVYAGKKQDSATAVEEYRRMPVPDKGILHRISEISGNLAATDDLDILQKLIEEHERILSNHLGIEPVKTKYFSDYPGAVKSLGAWGGDFLLFVIPDRSYDIHSYLNTKGLKVIYSYYELNFS